METSVVESCASFVAAAAAGLGIVQAVAGGQLVRRFARRPAGTLERYPPVTVLKPLHGDEPLLMDALMTFCRQDYPHVQLVFGVSHPHDPAVAMVGALRRQFPLVDMDLVVCDRQHGSNRKVSNLINMSAAARHDVLVIADSDLHVAPDYLRCVVAALAAPGVGLVTTLSVGLPATKRLPERLAAAQITYAFLPGVLLARGLGRQDCLGVTMAIRRDTLARVGGLAALADHLADDARLGGLVRAQGLTVGLAATLPATTVAEATLAAGFEHELRWARTIRAQAPVGYAASVLQFPIVLAGVACILAGFAQWAELLVMLAWTTRAATALGMDRSLRPMVGGCQQGRALRAPVLLLPLREAMAAAVMAASYRTRRVVWRGHTMYASRVSVNRRMVAGPVVTVSRARPRR